MGVIDTLTGNTTYLVLLILLIVYVPFYFHVRSSPGMAEKGVVTYGPFIMLKTARGVRFLDDLAKYRRFWRFFGTLSKIMAFFLMAMVIFILVFDLLLLPLMVQSEGLGVEYALAIPGLNPMLPLSYGIIGLVVAVAIHELAHGVQTRANGMKVESVGVLYAVVPVGAFVEPNEEEIRNTDRRARSSMYAAGIAINLTTALVLFLVMSFGLMGSMSSGLGANAAVVGTTQDSPADWSGIGNSSVIVGITAESDGIDRPMTYDEFISYSYSAGDRYKIAYATKDGFRSTDWMRLGVFIEGIASGSPAETAGIPKGSLIDKIETGGGTVYDIGNPESFRDAMTSLSPYDTVEVTYVHYDKHDNLLGSDTVSVVLGKNGDRAFLGVTYTFSGFSLTTPDAVLSAAKNPFNNAGSVSEATMAAFSYIGMPLRGYSPIPQEFTWWYHSSIMSDGAFWVVLQTVFWIFWLNLVLAVTNALPAVPFDGGYLLRDGIGSIVDRTHRNAAPERREAIVNTVTRGVSYVMLSILLLVMIVILF